MAASTITRNAWTDGAAGTTVNNAQLQIIYNKIDEMFAGAGSYATFEFGGGVKVDGVLEVSGFKENAPTVTISSNVVSVNMATQNVVPFTFNANVNTTTITNTPASGKYGSILWVVKANGSSFTWVWLTSTVVWDAGGAPTFVTTNNNVMVFLTYTVDGGTTWRGIVVAGHYAS